MGDVHDEKKFEAQAIKIWLFVLIIMVFGMISLGGITRLMGAGLSIVEWRPMTGWLPPFSSGEWLAEFQKYQAHSEFQKVNSFMSLLDFQQIYWWEYAHRLWGRFAGVVFFVPFLIFWGRGFLTPVLVKRCFLLLSIGGLQGLMGWVMVKSGLGNDPHVSPYKLMIHLWLALSLFGGLLWTLFSLTKVRSFASQSLTKLEKGWAVFLFFYVFVLIGYGALVAGFKAGWIYNTFPLMGGQWFPDDAWHVGSLWKNMISNPSFIQWIHRWAAIGLGGFVLGGSLFLRKVTPRDLLYMVLMQAGLGIVTLLHQIPVFLGALHQALGVLIFSRVLLLLWQTVSVQR